MGLQLARLKGFEKLTNADEALESFLSQLKPEPVGSELVPLKDALGRVTAQDVKAKYDLPLFDRSAVDGYALKAKEPNDVLIHPSMTAVGVMSRIFIDKNTRDPMVKKGVELIMEDLPKWDTNQYGMIDYYYWFYASYCLNQYGGSPWRKWNKHMKEVLLTSQRTEQDSCANGSWDPIDRWGDEGGRVYATAINVLTLEVYYRLGVVTRMKKGSINLANNK